MASEHEWRTSDGDTLARLNVGRGPVVAFALHAGHTIRPAMDAFIALDEREREREEDPFTARIAPDGMTTVEVVRSRFEVDLNRPRERAVYSGPEDAWGLELYAESLPAHIQAGSRAVYDEFYDLAYRLLADLERRHGRFVVLDLHSYNHRRDGAQAPAAPVELNPEVNLGTGRIDREQWANVVDTFVSSMAGAGFDCRENVRFRGGHFSGWVADTFPQTGVALAIEFKKTYMDEWTGRPDVRAISRIRAALDAATRRIAVAMAQMP